MVQFSYAAATLPAADLNRARKFYEETLGCQPEEEDEAGILYNVGSSKLFLYPSEFAGSNKATAASFEVADIEAAVKELTGKGVEFQQYDFPGLKTDENGIAQMGAERGAWFIDPEGNILAIGERTSQN